MTNAAVGRAVNVCVVNSLTRFLTPLLRIGDAATRDR